MAGLAYRPACNRSGRCAVPTKVPTILNTLIGAAECGPWYCLWGRCGDLSPLGGAGRVPARGVSQDPVSEGPHRGASHWLDDRSWPDFSEEDDKQAPGCTEATDKEKEGRHKKGGSSAEPFSVPDGPSPGPVSAYRAGLRVGQVILKLGEEPVENLQEFADHIKTLENSEVLVFHVQTPEGRRFLPSTVGNTPKL